MCFSSRGYLFEIPTGIIMTEYSGVMPDHVTGRGGRIAISIVCRIDKDEVSIER